MNYLSLYEKYRNNEEFSDYSLSYNKDNMIFNLINDLSPNEVFQYLNKYPDENYEEIKKILSEEYSNENFLVGAGSEDIIWKINNFLLKNLKVGVVVPNFYRIYETLDNVEFLFLPISIEKLLLDIEKLEQQIRYKKCQAVWISNPNPITGKGFLMQQLKTLVEKMSDILFIVDEASMDSVSDIKSYSLLENGISYPNLIILRTFSKYYGFPGIRLGYAAMDEKFKRIIEDQESVFPVSNYSVLLAKKLILKKSLFKNMEKKIDDHKMQLTKLVSNNTDFYVCNSLSNTLIIGYNNNSISIWDLLVKENILSFSVKEEKGLEFANAVRITIHSDEDSFVQLYKAVERMLGNINI
ncbi:aminotransferase class I/II-fold pyridoxal phosphate-dependent enzyme [Lachnotalea glycerini]|uniref:Aminotransferase class I/II-fold pyridoxal phosphate-dependent enzyme n=1 Tax=Lachnotalea glycerini TaxID=1763509 RepID=A0A371JJU7_9FIRM|nr:aminotransferase class I/II-fold pyridoxal phosphate-dependent enzyme [Lachnotalea glycerini]RDY33015.1 aminotransferase class I/II-fold pyridoxal phosphate-dependent enzyme [Lachnotalea glycerini]